MLENKQAPDCPISKQHFYQKVIKISQRLLK